MSDRTVRAVLTGSSAGAVRAFREVETAANKAGTGSSKAIEDSGKKIGGVFKSMLGAGLALGATVIGFAGLKDAIGGSIKAFTDQQDATVLLNQSMSAMGQKWTPMLRANFSDLNDMMLKYGDTSAQTTAAFSALVTAGVPASDAIARMAGIADLAARTHSTLADATQMVIKGAEGQGRAFKVLGIAVPPVLATTKALQSAQVAAATTVIRSCSAMILLALGSRIGAFPGEGAARC